jgi:hypothetical protein
VERFRSIHGGSTSHKPFQKSRPATTRAGPGRPKSRFRPKGQNCELTRAVAVEEVCALLERVEVLGGEVLVRLEVVEGLAQEAGRADGTRRRSARRFWV